MAAPPRAESYGDLAGKLSKDYGLHLEPWQQMVLDDWLGHNEGTWASMTCGLAVPRQNGKNGIIEVRELFGAIGLGEKILHTAHQVKTAQKHFRRLKYFFGRKANDPAARFPELNALVESVRNVNGQEAIYLLNGASIEIVARSTSSGRGFTVDVIVCDEAQSMSDDDLEALLSTSSAAPLGNPQWIYTGTPPGPKVNGEVFTRIHDDASGDPYRLSWHEWSADPSDDLDDREVWRRCNPGTIYGRLKMEVIEGERSRYSDEGFSRERLGIWLSEVSTRVIPSGSWENQTDPSSLISGSFALGVEVGPDLSWASVTVAGRRADDGWHIELVDDQHTRGRGIDWLRPMLRHTLQNNPQIKCVVADVGGPIRTILKNQGDRWWFEDPEDGARITVVPLRVAELGSACSLLLSGLVTGWLWHIGQPQLTSSALSAGKRALGDTGMWVWSRKSAESDITQIQSATYALHGARMDRVPSKPFKRARTGGSVAVL